MRWRPVIVTAVLLASAFLWWVTPEPSRPRRRPLTTGETFVPSSTPVVRADLDAGLPADASMPTPGPRGADPGGYCEGPAGPAGYHRRPPGEVIAKLLGQDLEAEGASDAVRAAVELCRQAWNEEDVEGALELAERAGRMAPGVAGIQASMGLLARRAGRPFEAADALGRAVAAAPEAHLLRRELAEMLALTPRSAEALYHLRRYAAAQPDDWEAQRRVRLLEVTRDAEEGFVDVPDPLFPARAYADVPRARVEALQQSLRDAVTRASALLGPLRDPVTVVLYRERADLLATTCAQGWSHAVYDGRMRFQDEPGGVLSRPETQARVAAHELTHVLYRRHRARNDGWLVEGVARYVAREEDRGYAHTLSLMGRSASYIPFSSMMGTLQGLEHADDSAMAYDQALMMVHWVVDTAGEDGLRTLLRSQDGAPEAVLERVTGVSRDGQGAAFLAWARKQPPTGSR